MKANACVRLGLLGQRPKSISSELDQRFHLWNLIKLSEESLIKDLYILLAVRIQTRRSTLRSGSLFSLYLPVFISVNVSSRLGARLSGSALRCGAGRGASRCTLRMTGRFKYTVKRLKKKKIANGMKICRQVNSLMSSKTNLWKK